MNKKFRILLVAAVFGLVIFALVFNVTYTAVTGKHLISQENIADSDFAQGRGSDSEIIYANRGNIYSSDNELLATNIISYKLIAILDENRISEDTTTPTYVYDPVLYAQELSPILGMSEDAIRQLIDVNMYADPDNAPYQVELGSLLTYDQKKQIEDLGLPGLEFEKITRRNYRYGSLAAQTIGYAIARRVDGDEDSDGDGELDQIIPDLNDIVGYTGIEYAYNDLLSGTNGSISANVDSYGYTLPDGITNKVEAKDGDDIYLTINTNVQREAEIYMEDLIAQDNVNYVWAMSMDAHTGKILCIASAPTYDLNTLDTTYFNYNLDYAYECGSIVKPFVYCTAIENGEYPYNTTYTSGSYSMEGGVVIHDWDRNGWGNVSYDEGLIRSSNVAICHLVNDYIPEEQLRDTYEKLGYWEAMDLDGLPVTSGVSNIDNSWVDFTMTGFGQSSTWTAFHLLRAYTIFANAGCIVEPYLVDYIIDSNTNEVVYKATTEKSEQIFSADTCNYVNGLMKEVINDYWRGTAVQYMMDDITISGKSGTGQIWQNGTYDSGIYNYSIAILAPADDPEIVMVCGIQGEENVHHGEFAEMVMSLVRSSLNAVHGTETSDNGTTETTVEYTMPNFMNHTVDYSRNVLSNSGLTPTVIGDGNSVVDQYPAEGEVSTSSSRIFLLTDGSNIIMPDLTGWTRKEAAIFGSLAGLTIRYDGSGNNVTAQSVEVGATLHKGDSIAVALG